MRLFDEYDVAAAIHEHMPPASLMPSCSNLAGLVFAVVHHLVFIDRLVHLTLLAEDADLAEQAFHAEGARFIDQNRHDALAELVIAQQR